MAQLLWQKPGVEVDAKIQAFLAGDDVILDREFLLYDIAASKAHAQGLQHIGILSAEELDGLLRELDALAADYRSGAFVLDERYEDCHSAIEFRLTERLGDAGRKIHTGRSRNDQILVATRLWLKEKLQRVAELSREVAGVALERAQAEQQLPLPGYTHIQRAVVSSAGMWWAGWAEAFIDNAIRASDTLRLVDANPLGTAAGYGVNLPLDRAHTTAELGFARLQISPIYAQLSRGKFELAALEALGAATLDLRRIAWDLSLYTSAEFGFVALPAQYTTGSSIMPNKRNPDVIELMRACHASVAGARSEIEQLLSLPSGYQRDLQDSKGAIVRGFARGLAALELLPALLANLEWREERLRAAIDSGMYATDVAVEAAVAGIPFREAYKAAAASADSAGQGRTPEGSLAARVSPGAAADLQLEVLKARAGRRWPEMAVVDRASAVHYLWGDGCDGWHLLHGDDLGVIEERMPPGSAEQRHLHRRARQFFYVLAGQAVLELEGVTHVLGAGQGLHVPPGCAHQMRNDAAEELRFLLVSAPHSHGDREPAPTHSHFEERQ